MKRLLTCLFILLLTANVSAEISDNSIHPKIIVTEIVKHDPFPHKKTKTRWTLDIDNNFDLKEESKSNQIAEYIIVIMAAIAEYILWFLLALGILLIYLNRKLFLFENIKTFQLRKKTLKTKTLPNEQQLIVDNVLSKAQDLYDQGQMRESIKLLYNTFIKKINDMEVNVSTSLTEKEVFSVVSNQSQTLLTQLAEKLINLRSKTAYQQKVFSKDELNSVCMQWQEVFSNED